MFIISFDSLLIKKKIKKKHCQFLDSYEFVYSNCSSDRVITFGSIALQEFFFSFINKLV